MITDKVKSIEDVYAIKGIDPTTFFNENDTPDEKAYKQVKMIAEVLNEGWQPNWKDSNEYKYYPWFWMDRAGSGFSFNVYVTSITRSTVGSRLCFKSEELAEYAGMQFLSIYEDFFKA